MVGHFAALPCPRRWRTSFRPHRLGVFLPPGTAVGCSLRALGSCPVQRCSQRPERNFKPLEQYGREPVCRRRAKGTRPWPTFPPLALFWNVLRGGSSSLGAWIGEGAWRGRVWAARGRERPTGLSRGWGAGETEWKQVPAAPDASEQSYRWERRPEALSPSSFPSPGDAAASPSARTRFCGLVSSQVFGAWEQRSVRRRTVRAGPRRLGRRASPRRVRFGRAAASGVGREKERALAASPSGRCCPQAETRRRGRPVLLPGSRPPRPRVPRSRTCASGTVRPGVSAGGRLVGGACPPSTGTPLGSAPLGAGADIRTQRPGHARPQPSCVCVGPWT